MPPRKKTVRKTKTKFPDVLLVTERDYLPVLLRLIESAKHSIDIIEYSFAIGAAGPRREGNTAFEVAKALVDVQKKRGKDLKIRLYLEGERDTAERNQMTAAYLQKNGIKVRWGATHAKGFQVDGRYVLFGSTNLTHQSIAKNFETNLLLQDSDISAGFEMYFQHLWEGGRHGGIDLPEPLFADGAFKAELLDLIGTAKKTLEFSIYFFQQADIEKALIAAAKRGVKIHGIIHNHFAFAMSYVRRTRATAERLRKDGAKNLVYGSTGLFTHSKYIVRDREELMLGTGNWLDEDVEIHPQLYIRLADPKLATQLAKHLREQMRELS